MFWPIFDTLLKQLYSAEAAAGLSEESQGDVGIDSNNEKEHAADSAPAHQSDGILASEGRNNVSQ